MGLASKHLEPRYISSNHPSHPMIHRWGHSAVMVELRVAGMNISGLPLLLLLLASASGEAQNENSFGKAAVFMNGRWTQFDENDDAGVPQPYPPKTDSWTLNDTSIMVSISSFRDYRCPKTLYNLFTYVWDRDPGDTFRVQKL